MVTNAANVTAYVTWGVNGEFYPTNNAWAIDGKVVFSGSRGWYPMTTIESYNGQWSPPDFNPIGGLHQQSYLNWFKANAFDGANYANTPVGGTSTVDEPQLSGKTQVDACFRLWSRGKHLGLASWIADGFNSANSDGVNHLNQTTGDPLVTR